MTSLISGWVQAIGTATTGSASAAIYYRVATGGDTAPTIPAVTGAVIAAHLEEWSGGATTVPNDRVGATNGTTSPITATMAGGADAASGELVAMAGADFRSVARASNDTWTSNNGTPVLRASNNGVSSVNHYSHATLVTTGNASADTAVMTLSITSSITGLAVAAASFKLGPAVSTRVPRHGFVNHQNPGVL
jgi:hypothetical protein